MWINIDKYLANKEEEYLAEEIMKVCVGLEIV